MSLGVLIEQAEPLARRLLEERQLAGLVIGVAHEGRPLFAGAYGHADIELKKAMTTSTAVRVGSITKTFTALAVAQLVERGLVDWDDPIERHVSAYAVRPARGARPITVRDVLTHTSGLGEWRRLREAVARSIPFGVDDGEPMPSLAEFYRGGLRADTAPGRRFSYSNHAMATLGQLVEEVTGVDFAEYVRASILEPLGMSDSDLMLTDAVRHRLARGYTAGSNGLVRVPYQHIAIGAAGSLHASLDDMLRYAAWLTAPADGGVIAPSTLATMFERHWEPDRRLPGQGLGWACDDVAGEAVAHHDGGWPGFVASLQIVPGRDFAVFAATNTFDLAPRLVTDTLVRGLLGAPAPPDRVSAAAVTAHPEVVRRLAGVYAPERGVNSNARWWTEFGGELRLDVQGDGLLLSTPEGGYAEGVLLVAGDPDDPLFWIGAGVRLDVPFLLRLRFREDGDGRVVGFDGGLPSIIAMRKYPAVRSVRVYKPAAIAAVAALATVALVAGVRGLRSRRRGRRRSGRRDRRSRPR